MPSSILANGRMKSNYPIPVLLKKPPPKFSHLFTVYIYDPTAAKYWLVSLEPIHTTSSHSGKPDFISFYFLSGARHLSVGLAGRQAGRQSACPVPASALRLAPLTTYGLPISSFARITMMILFFLNVRLPRFMLRRITLWSNVNLLLLRRLRFVFQSQYANSSHPGTIPTGQHDY